MTIDDMLLGKWFRVSASNLTALVMVLLPAASLAGVPAATADRDDTPPDALIGYTEFRTDLPGGLLDAVRRLVPGREGGPPEPRLEE